MRYAKFERLVLMVIAVAVAIMALSMVLQKTDGVEVFGHLLMLAVILSSIYGGKRGALLGPLACLAAYTVARVVWLGGYSGGVAAQLIAMKLFAYGLLALLCHHVRTQFRYFFVKMEQQDLVDDETQVGNARFLKQELSRCIGEHERYQKPFSLVLFSFEEGFLSAMGNKGVSALRDLTATVFKPDTRSVDEIARVGNRICALLPNVGREGAEVCARRLAGKVRAYLSRQEGGGESQLEVTVLGYPEDREKVEEILAGLEGTP